ncbi:UNVERIFIED_CONTAM: hypothetical protein ABIE34_003914 [Jeotgalibacillus campisalis]
MVPEPVTSSTHAPAGVGSPATPQQAWTLASLIAGEPSYRLGRWIGQKFQYPRPTRVPKITRTLPERPAAVTLHGPDGRVSTLCLDLDTSKALKHVVDADAAQLANLLQTTDVGFVEDFSPSGGRHLYIPLRERMDAAEARELVEAFSLMAASLDPSPHQNITDGCIRVPGSPHKSGGHQTLITPLAQAYDVLRHRNSTAAIQSLKAALAPELARNRARKARETKMVTAQRSAAALSLTAAAGSEAPLRRVARTGLYDTARYKSPSEARMAVLNHFAACGWSREQVQNELGGQFPGLAGLYGSVSKQERLLPTEWAKAQAFTANQTAPKGTLRKVGEKTALINNTSLTEPTGGALQASPAAMHQLVNDLENIVYAVLDHRLQTRGRESLGLRLLMRGLLGYVRAMQTDVLDVGCRTLAVAMGKHHVTIARLLPVLAKASDGILSKVADARHKAADVYVIQLPEHFKQLARELTWRKGQVHAVRPVFRALGDVAALIYEAIERGRHSPTTADLVRTTGISRNAAAAALADMEALAMIKRDGRHWRVTTVNLTNLAARLGVLVDYQEHISRNRRERAVWHAYLDRFTNQEIGETDLYDTERDEHWLPPDDQSALWLAA